MEELPIVIVGGDLLALEVCEQLMVHEGHVVTVLWDAVADFDVRVERLGAKFVERRGDAQESLRAAGVESAAVVIALSDDDHVNLQYALGARDVNPAIRLVMRQFNRTLGRKIAERLENCAVLSMSSHAAATYAACAVDPACRYGLTFPVLGDGQLVGIFRRAARDIDAETPAQVEARHGFRVVAVGREFAFDRDAAFGRDQELWLAGCVVPRTSHGAHRHSGGRVRSAFRGWLRDVRRLDAVTARAVVLALAVFMAAGVYFAAVLHLDPITAAYFVASTMTTTGYGDITPRGAGYVPELAAILLMLSGITFTGVFIAILTSHFTQARYEATQGVRRIARSGHIIVCGAGNVGSRVIEYLLRLGQTLVVIETAPTPEIIGRARDRQFQLLTGDASKDTTLDLCNLAEASALVALTNSDTMNLEIALGAKARNPDLHVVLRVQHAPFQSSLRKHFELEHTYGTARLAAPVLSGLAISAGARGLVKIADREFAVAEFPVGAGFEPPDDGCIPLCVYRDGAIALVDDFARARDGDRVLFLFPSWRLRRDLDAAHIAHGVTA